MKELIVKKERFDFDSFTKATLEFLSMIISDKVHPSTAITRVESLDDIPEWGPEKGRSNFLNELTEGYFLFFPFTATNVGEPIDCANGKSYEIDDDTECNLSEVDTDGFLVKLEKGNFIINSAFQAGGGQFPPYFEITDCGVFDKPMKRFVNKFVGKLEPTPNGDSLH